MPDIPNIAEIAALMGDPARACMLAALKDDHVLTATELAHIAGVAPNTASGHLAKLVAAKLIVMERSGRHRHYRLAGTRVAEVLELLEALAVTSRPPVRRHDPRGASIRFARICYDHLAGDLGIALTWSLVERGYLGRSKEQLTLRRRGTTALTRFGIDLDLVRGTRRRFIRLCPDWSGRRPHLGGALGASLFAHLVEIGWLCRSSASRAVFVTGRGRRGLRDMFGVEAPASPARPQGLSTR